MSDVHAALCAIRNLALSRPVYLLRTVPPSLVEEFVTKWDHHVKEVMTPVMEAEKLTTHAEQVMALKPKHGGVGITRLADVSRVPWHIHPA